MGILIDSSVLIAWERDRLDLQPQLEEYTEEDFAISAITASELLHGVHRAANPAQRRRREAFVEGLLARLPILSFDAVAARIHARNFRKAAFVASGNDITLRQRSGGDNEIVRTDRRSIRC